MIMDAFDELHRLESQAPLNDADGAKYSNAVDDGPSVINVPDQTLISPFDDYRNSVKDSIVSMNFTTRSQDDEALGLTAETSLLYKLYRLQHSFSDLYGMQRFTSMLRQDKRKFLCDYLRSYSNDKNTCEQIRKTK